MSSTGRPCIRRYLVRGEMLSASEIATRTGLTRNAVASRISLGWVGDDLLLPLHGDRQSGNMRRCAICGGLFPTRRGGPKYCSAECRKIAGYRGTRLPGKAERPAEKPKQSLAEVARAARDAGLSYGQYMAKRAKGRD